MKIYDLIIIGAGPAGMTAGIYAKNFGLDCLIIGEKTGGLINSAYKVENYPGIFDVSGKELTKKFLAHQKYLKIAFKKEKVERISKSGKIFKIFSKFANRRNQYQARAIILAFGTETKKLNIKNIEKFENKGVHYRLDDSAFLSRTIKRSTQNRGHGKSTMVRGLFRNKTAAVVGGANAAVMSAVALAEKAKKVYLLYRREKLRASALWVDKIKKLKNIEVIYRTNVVDLKGRNKLEKIILDNGKELKIDGLFIEAGVVPNTFLIKKLGIKIDKNGYIKTDKSQATNIKGIFAAGDTTIGSNEFRQIITACSEGAIAALGVFNFLFKK